MKTPKKHKRPVQVRNLDLARAMVGKRTSNAAGKHADRRTRRNRSRSAQNANALRDQS